MHGRFNIPALVPVFVVAMAGLAASCSNGGDAEDAGPLTPVLYDAGPLVFPDAGPVVDAGPTDAGPINTVVQVLAVSPARASTDGNVRVLIEGQGLSPETICLFGEVAATNCIALDTQRLRCEVPPQTADGFVDVRCENTRGAGELSAGFLYFYPIRVDAVTPDVGAASGGEPVTVTGIGFTPEMLVMIGGRRAVGMAVNATGTVATVLTPPGTPGRQDVAAIDTFSRSALRLSFTYQASLSLDQVVPAIAEVGDVVELRGAGFVEGNGAAVAAQIDATTADRDNLINASRMRVLVPAVAGTVDVGVARTDGLGTVSAALTDALVVLPALTGGFVLTAVVPNVVDVAGGSEVVIAGEGFSAAAITTVTIGGVLATAVNVLDDRRLEVVAPAHAAGAVDVEVVRADGITATLVGGLSYDEQLRVTSVAPVRGPAAGGTVVTVAGQAFGNDATAIDVRFGGIPATNVSVSAGVITCTTPEGAAGEVDVAVRVGANAAVLRSAFLFEATLSVLGVEPARGGVSGDTVVTIAGTGFAKLKASEDLDTRIVAWFGDQPAVTRTIPPQPMEVVVVNDSLITLRTPFGLPGRVDVRVGLFDITSDAAANPPTIRVAPALDEAGVAIEASADDAFTYFDPTSVVGGTRGGPVEGAMYVTALNYQGLPIEDVLVFLGTDGQPDVADLTNVIGQATLSGPTVFGAQTVTLVKEGYETAVVPDVNAQEITLFLQPLGGGEGEGEGEPPPPNSILRGRVFGFAKEFFDPAALGPDEVAIAFVNVTSRDEFSGKVARDAQVFEEGGEFELTVPPNRTGRMALVATAGIYNLETGEFRPRQLGIRREVFLEFGSNLIDQDIDLNIPLDRNVEVSLPDSPLQEAGPIDTRAVIGLKPTITRVGAFLQLGGEGSHFLTLTHAASRNHAISEMPDVPGEMLTFLAGAYNTTGRNLFDDQGVAVARSRDSLITGGVGGWAQTDPFTGAFLAIGQVLIIDYPDGTRFASDIVGVESATAVRLRQQAPQDGDDLVYHIGQPGPPSSEVFQDGVGDLRSGLTIQPVLGLPTLISPEENGAIIDRTITWKAAPGQLPTLHQMNLLTFEQLWTFYVDGGRGKITIPKVPELDATLRALPVSERILPDDYVPPSDLIAGPFFWFHNSIYTPGVTFENWSFLDIGGRGRRSWTEDQRVVIHGAD